MAKAKIIKQGVVHLMHDGVRHTLRAGDTVPEWAEVTNPALFVEVEGESSADEATSTTDTRTVNSDDTGKASTEQAAKEPSQKELREQAKTLGISTSGSKADLAKRIAAKLAESAPAAGSEDEDEHNGDRAALESKARELGIGDFDENTTDEELTALIEDKE